MLNKFWTSETAPVLRSLDAGASPVLVSGVGAASRAHMAAALRKHTGQPLFVVCPDDAAAGRMYRDLTALLGEEGALLTSREYVFLPAESASREAEQKRLRALAALSDGVALAVCSVGALLQRTVPPKSLAGAAFTLAAGESRSLEEIETALLRCGYVHRVQVDAPGQYARRGGILDFFSPAYDVPVRAEFWGDEIDAMGFFDVTSQRRTENVERCLILPAAEALPSLHEGGENALADELSLAAARFSRSRRSESHHLAETLRADAERLRETKLLPGADRYLELIFPEFACALDYIPPEAVVFLDQPSKLAKLCEEQTKSFNEDLRTLVQGGELMPKCVYRMGYSECAARLQDWPVVMGDSFPQGRCVPEPRSAVSVTSKQLPSYGGSFDAAVEDVRRYLADGFAVLALCADERRCALLADFLLTTTLPRRPLKPSTGNLARGCAPPRRERSRAGLNTR